MEGQNSRADSGTDPTLEAKQAWLACASVLESAATALMDLVTSLRAAAAQMREEPAPAAEHTCVMPRGAPVFTICRCPCGQSYRLYPPEPASGNPAPQWREI